MVNNSSPFLFNIINMIMTMIINMDFERLVTKNLPAGTYRKAKISSVDVIKLDSKKITTGCPQKKSIFDPFFVVF